jgi:hypothetical protein
MSNTPNSAPKPESNEVMEQVIALNVDAINSQDSMRSLFLLAPIGPGAPYGYTDRLPGPIDTQNRAMLYQVYAAVGARLGEAVAFNENGAEGVTIPLEGDSYIVEADKDMKSMSEGAHDATTVKYFR